MQSSKKILIVAVSCVILGLAVWLIIPKSSPAPAPDNSIPVATTTTTVVASTTISKPTITTLEFSVNAADTIGSWSVASTYANNPAQTASTHADSAHLKSLMGKGEYDDYDLYIGIGNDALLLGDGKGAYNSYNKAISIHPTKGLAYVNQAHLMDQLGAYHTAADAYAKAVAVEPSMPEYHTERISFLMERFPNDSAQILASIADAHKQFGDTVSVLALEARWLTGVGRYADAIGAWERAKALSVGSDVSSIDTEIARLKAKQ